MTASEKKGGPIEGSANTILKQVGDSQYGEHNIVVYPDVKALNEVLADCYRAALEERNELALFVSHYQTASKVREVLGRFGLDVPNHEHKGSLIIFDSVKAYQGLEGSYAVMSLVNMLFDRVRKLGKDGMFGMADMGSFFLYERIEALMSYELSLPSIWKDMKMRSFCIYHSNDFARLSEEERKALIDHHYKFIKNY